MRSFGRKLLIAYGAQESQVNIVVDHLIENHLRGVQSQGLMRVMEYSTFLDEGFMNASACPTLEPIKNNIFKINGDNGFGIVAMDMAVKAMSEALHREPFAMAAVINVGHTGRLGAYSEYLSSHNNAYSAVFGGGGHEKYKSVAPFGGRKGVMSTNPISMSMPAKEGVPISADFATSSTAGGKIRFARDAGLQLPENQILDNRGHPTTCPNDYFSGGVILPSAGPKGYGLGLICEMLCYAMLGSPLQFNWFLIAFNIDVFATKENYDRRASEFLDLLEQCPPAPGFNRVSYPGQFENLQKKINLVEGLAIEESTLRKLCDFAEQKGLSVPESLIPLNQ